MPYYKSGSKYFTAGNKLFSSSWNPNNIEGMIFWGKSEKRYIIENDNYVSKWKDNSGLMNDAIQETGISQPLFVNYENAPALHFTGGFLKIPLTINRFTIFTVIKSTSSDIVYEFGNSTLTETGFYLNGDRNTIGVSNSGFSNLVSAKDNGIDWLAGGGWTILTHQYNGTHISHKLYENRILQGANTYFGYNDDPGVLNKSANLNLGSRYDGSDATDSYIREFIVYDKYLSYNDINKTTLYLAKKHGLQ